MLSLFLCLTMQGLPLDPVAMAAFDCRRIAKPACHHTRYLWVGGMTVKDQELAVLVLNSHCNRLSWQPEIVRLHNAGPGLLRLDLRDYGWRVETWEKLRDPYFSVTVVETVKTKVKKPFKYTDGSTRHEEIEEETKVEKPAFAPWHNGFAAKELLEATQSNAPIVNGAWFFNQTAIQVRRKPGYYDFLGIVNEKDFDRLVGFDPAVLKNFPKESREVISMSEVTHRARRIDRAPTVGGGYWRTSDNEETRDDERNPLLALGDKFKFDARRSFGHLPNGMLAWWLGDAKGVRQDDAPKEIAGDRTVPTSDTRVHINLSCIGCHDAGIKDMQGWARSTYQAPNALILPGKDYEEDKRLRQLYLGSLERHVNRDRSIYADAILAANGCTTEVDSVNYVKFFRRYEYARVDLKWAARDLGVTPQHLLNAVNHRLATTGKIDPRWAAWRSADLPIDVTQWEGMYASTQTMLRGYVP